MSHLTRVGKELLTFGYTRNQCELSIPSDIIFVVLSFSDNTIRWSLKGEEVDQFYDCKNGHCLAGPQHVVKDIAFVNTLW